MAKAKEVAVIAVDKPFLTDLNGNDAMLQSPAVIRQQVQNAALASLPEIYLRAMKFVKESKNEKTVLEAMKFIHQLGAGEIKAKHVESVAKQLSDAEILEKLSKDFEGEVDAG